MIVEYVWTTVMPFQNYNYDGEESGWAKRVVDFFLGGTAATGGLLAEVVPTEGRGYGLTMSILAFLTLVFRAWQSERDRKRKDDTERSENREKRHALADKLHVQRLEIEHLRGSIEDLEAKSEEERRVIDDMKMIRSMDRESIARNSQEIERLKRENEELRKRVEETA